MRKALPFIFSVFSLVPALAQAPAAGGSEQLNRYLLVVLFGAIIFLLALVVFILFQLTLLIEKKTTVAVPAEERATLWQSILGLKPIAKEKELILHEDFDGIQELDNPVPTWFNALFYGTIAAGIVYLLVFHVWKSADLQDDEYTKEVQVAEIKREAYLKTVANSIDENSVQLSTKDADLAKGKDLFTANCAACHGQKGEGLVGPNLTDEYWLHGGTVSEVFKVVKYGVPAKGMISWEKQLNPLQIQQVASFILSLQGTNPPNGKEPQGEKASTGAAKLSMN
jgi:cytochrome c oxidase cbb3-type subunit III